MGAFGWSACVGDDPTTNSGNDEGGGPGSIGNACFANGTCDQGLSCISNVCVDLDSGASTDGASGPQDSSTVPGTTTDAADNADASATSCDASVLSPANIPCPDTAEGCTPDGGEFCCATKGGNVCERAGAACADPQIACLTVSACGGGACCVAATDPSNPFVDTTCPGSAVLTGAACKESCGKDERTVCTTDADCKVIGLSCRSYLVTYAGAGADMTPVGTGMCVAEDH